MLASYLAGKSGAEAFSVNPSGIIKAGKDGVARTIEALKEQGYGQQESFFDQWSHGRKQPLNRQVLADDDFEAQQQKFKSFADEFLDYTEHAGDGKKHEQAHKDGVKHPEAYEFGYNTAEKVIDMFSDGRQRHDKATRAVGAAAMASGEAGMEFMDFLMATEGWANIKDSIRENERLWRDFVTDKQNQIRAYTESLPRSSVKEEAAAKKEEAAAKQSHEELEDLKNLAKDLEEIELFIKVMQPF